MTVMTNNPRGKEIRGMDVEVLVQSYVHGRRFCDSPIHTRHRYIRSRIGVCPSDLGRIRELVY